jgi:hypothetical protein
MKLYEMAVVTQVVMVRANSEDEAEAKMAHTSMKRSVPAALQSVNA